MSESGRNKGGHEWHVLPRGEARNPTSQTGYAVHANDGHGYPGCGKHVKGVVYTASPVNCQVCLGVKPNHGTGGGKRGT